MRNGNALIPILFFFVLCAIELVAILRLNEGHLAYTLDDPYIHLALAENIATGHYGVNLGEHSAPASSILWPLLLAPLAGTALGPTAPLVLNLLAAALAIAIFSRIVAAALPSGNGSATRVGQNLLVCLLVLATNLVGLVFTGMEHSLQILATAVVVLGIIHIGTKDRVPWWLLAAIIVGPLIRYENAAVSAIGILYLLFTRRWKAFWIASIVTGVALLAFSAYLHSLDLYPVPTSVVAKSGPVAGKGDMLSIFRNLLDNLTRTQGILVALGIVLLTAVALRRDRTPHDRILASSAALGLALHMVIGRFGWFHRYEIYAWCALLLTLIYLHRDAINTWVQSEPGWKFAAVVVPMTLAISWSYIYDLRLVPLASNNVYEQHFQMHRFATQFYRKPIAVNDIGWVTYGNEAYVLDLVGLSSIEALRAQWENTGPAWMNRLAEKHDIKAAMIYPSVFAAIPDNWKLLATLHLSRRKITVFKDAVAVYALNAEIVPELSTVLREFAASLPKDVKLEFASANGAAQSSQ
jgi:hypothetical protein